MDSAFSKRNAEVTDALKEVLEQAKDEGMEAPQEIHGDLEAAFRSKYFQDLLQSKEIIWRPKTGTKRENLGNTAQLDSAIGRWRRALRTQRIGDAKWFEYIDVATEAVNQKSSRSLRGATPADAFDDEEAPLLAFQQSEKSLRKFKKEPTACR